MFQLLGYSLDVKEHKHFQQRNKKGIIKKKERKHDSTNLKAIQKKETKKIDSPHWVNGKRYVKTYVKRFPLEY